LVAEVKPVAQPAPAVVPRFFDADPVSLALRLLDDWSR
jgi:hypothetical protein